MHEVLKVCQLFVYPHNFEVHILFYSFLKEPASAKQTFSSSKEPSAFQTIPVLEYLKEMWGNMANHPKFSEVKGSIYKGIENLNKWYYKVNGTDAYFICLCMYPFTLYSPIKIYLLTFWFIVLDPNVKNVYALDKWDAQQVWVSLRKWCVLLYQSSLGHYEKPNVFFFHSLILTTSHLPKNYQFQPHPHVCWNKYWSSRFFDFSFSAHNIGSGQYGYSWMCTSVCSHQEAELVGSGPRDELKRYLDSPLEEVNVVVAWWRVSRFSFHPSILTGLNYIASLIPIPYPFKNGP